MSIFSLFCEANKHLVVWLSLPLRYSEIPVACQFPGMPRCKSLRNPSGEDVNGRSPAPLEPWGCSWCSRGYVWRDYSVRLWMVGCVRSVLDTAGVLSGGAAQALNWSGRCCSCFGPSVTWMRWNIRSCRLWNPTLNRSPLSANFWSTHHWGFNDLDMDLQIQTDLSLHACS